MEWIKGTNIDFMKTAKLWGTISFTAVTISVILIFFPGPKYGIDFSGGTEIQFSLEKAVPIGELRAKVERAGFSSTDLVQVGEKGTTYRIKLQAEVAFTDEQIKSITNKIKKRFESPGVEYVKFSPGGEKITIKANGNLDTKEVESFISSLGLQLREREIEVAKKTKAEGEGFERCLDPVCKVGRTQDYIYEVSLAGISGAFFKKLSQKLGNNKIHIEEIEWVGPRVGKQFRNAGILSLLYAWGLILLYTALRFDIRFAPGAVLCLIHDTLITIGIFVILRREVVLSTVAALLTIIGYSINDTIVVYDRIRENLTKIKERELRLVINKSINETLSRTIITSLTTVMAIMPVLFITRGTIQDFALALTIGIVVGTYSSIYIAAPISIVVDNIFYKKKVRK